MPSNLANPEPVALKWARVAAGYEPETVANKLKIASDRLIAWESGRQFPTFTQLRNLAKVYKRPTAIFYLRELPAPSATPTDFRTEANERPDKTGYSVELLHELRRARDRRDWALEMLSELGKRVPVFELEFTTDTPPERAAELLRKELGISIATQHSWRDEYTAFGAWRARVEKIGILCFQAKKLPTSECRGFSITERPLPAIVELSSGSDGLDKRLKTSSSGIIKTDKAIETEVKAIAISHPALVDLKRQKSVGDPYVIAVAKVHKCGVVTQESSKPNKVKIPHVCQHYGIGCCKLLEFMRTQNWRF